MKGQTVDIHMRMYDPKEGNRPENAMEALIEQLTERFLDACQAACTGKIKGIEKHNPRIFMATMLSNIILNSVLRYNDDTKSSKLDMLTHLLTDVSSITTDAVQKIMAESANNKKGH